MNPQTFALRFVSAFASFVARANELVAFGDLPFTDHLAERPKAEGKTYARQLRLAVKGKLVDVQGVKPGEWAVVDGDNVTVLGKEVDIIPICYLDKAVDNSGEDVIVAFGLQNEEYQRIAAELAESGFESGCMVGPCFLVYERTQDAFFEIFCNNRSLQNEAERGLFPALPITAAQAEAHGKKAKSPDRVLATSKYLDKGKYPRQVPVFKAGSAQYDAEILEALPARAQEAAKNFVAQSIREDEDRDR